MRTSGLSISALALGALLGLPAAAARAAEPTTVDEAQAAAQASRDKAEFYGSLGGVGYKTGLEQRAQADAAKYDTMAQTLASPTVTQQMLDQERLDNLEAHYRALGGVTYKTGIEQRGEAAARMEELTAPPAQPSLSCLPTKPSVDALCAFQNERR